MKKSKEICWVTTAEFAAEQLVKPATVRSRYCLTGSYHSVVPRKTLSGRLAWPVQVADIQGEVAS